MRMSLLGIPSVVVAAALTLPACGGGDSSAPPPATPEATAKASTPAPAKDPNAPTLPTKPDSAKVTWKQDPTLASCHNDVKTGKDLVVGVTAMASACAGPTKMHQIGATVQGSRTNLDPAQAIPLHAEANHCYRVYGLSEDALQDLDIAVIDSAGKSCGEDGSDSPDAVVLEGGAICFTAADDVKVNVAAGAGAGKFAVEIWGD
jgi:hypothetical protein